MMGTFYSALQSKTVLRIESRSGFKFTRKKNTAPVFETGAVFIRRCDFPEGFAVAVKESF
jgi:hypothetical protein